MRARVGESCRIPACPTKACGGEGHHRHRADDHHDDADPQVGPLVADEARRDALVDDVALLEEQLPRRDGGADDADDQQHDVADLAARRHSAG